MADTVRGVFEAKEAVLKSILEISSEIKKCTVEGSDASGYIAGKERLLSELAEADLKIAAVSADKKNEIPKDTVLNINSLLNELIKTEKEIESIVSSKIEHLKGNYVNAYKKLDKNR